MKSITPFFFLFTLCLFFVPQEIVANQNNAITDQILQTCEHTVHNDLCITSLASDPISEGANQTGLALVALKVASQNASDITDQVKVLANDDSLEPGVQQGVSDCMDHYLDAAEQLEDSIAALLVGAFDDVKTWVNVAIGDVDQCDAAFKGLKNVMSKNNKVFHQLCENALAIIEALAAGKWFFHIIVSWC